MVFSAKRSNPIGEIARNFLIDLVQQEEILHSRKTDGRVCVLKKRAWQRVADKFNAAGYGDLKDAQQRLKTWERIKMK